MITACSQEPTFVREHGQLVVDGTKLTDENGDTLVLRGMSFGWSNWWPQFWNADVVSKLVNDWNCTVIRAAMGVEHEDGYLERPQVSDSLVRQVVDACLKEGVYVIIDWHDHNAVEHVQEAKTFFTDMAETYGQYPNIIYEIYNEPDNESWEAVKAYSDTLIRTIRDYDPLNIILVGSPHWDQDVHVAADDPLTGYSNIMYTLHFYAKTHKQWLCDRGDYALKQGLPLFVSEYGGSEASGDGGLDLESWRLWVDWMETNQISWVKWSIADKQETCSALLPGANARGNWTEADLDTSGLLAKKLIRNLNRGSKQDWRNILKKPVDK
ncbi:MAG: glycoside hydrolase family 5 protein [candidate division KSB1 bacterium]|nr:glycoside hydrolase family 5 protein [candidate division KSB1 bacterium]